MTPRRALRLPQGACTSSNIRIIPNIILASPLFAMSGDGVDDIRIPMVFLFMEEAKKLLEVLFIFPPAAFTQSLFAVLEVGI